MSFDLNAFKSHLQFVADKASKTPTDFREPTTWKSTGTLEESYRDVAATRFSANRSRRASAPGGNEFAQGRYDPLSLSGVPALNMPRVDRDNPFQLSNQPRVRQQTYVDTQNFNPFPTAPNPRNSEKRRNW